jgi:predicted nucleotide-binding protein
MTFRRLIGGAMPNADALDIVFRHPPAQQSRRVFLTRRDSGNVLQRVKELVASGQFEPVVAREHDTASEPLLCDLIEQMRGCDTAVIRVTAGAVPAGADRQPGISGDVLIEIGAAMALYGREFVLLVEDAVELPSFLHGLRECRYAGDELNVPAMMRLLCALKSFTRRLSERPLASSDAVFAFRYMQKPDEAAVKH